MSVTNVILKVGWTGTMQALHCPKCGNHDSTKVSVTRRVCGYLGSPDARPFNFGKQEKLNAA
ncbi:hypothetical protein O9992_28995 [Vibrio lentus]|nr:hypothetical protein [Vibrio lentus]